jgi:hypothetical protein
MWERQAANEKRAFTGAFVISEPVSFVPCAYGYFDAVQ